MASIQREAAVGLPRRLSVASERYRRHPPGLSGSPARSARPPQEPGWPALLATAAAQAVVALVLGLGTCTVLPALAGSTPFVITSGSMGPVLRGGDVLVTRRLQLDDLRIGQIVVVADPTRPDRQVAHRIAYLNQDGTATLRGDANTGDDSTPVPVADILGAGHLVVPMIGLPVVWASTGLWGHLAATALIASLTLLLATGSATIPAPRRGRGAIRGRHRYPPRRSPLARGLHRATRPWGGAASR